MKSKVYYQIQYSMKFVGRWLDIDLRFKTKAEAKSWIEVTRNKPSLYPYQYRAVKVTKTPVK